VVTEHRPYPGKPLRIGSRGADVEAVQRALRDLHRSNRHLAVDGVYGPKTADLVSVFKRHRGLRPDGIMGARAWALLFPKPKPPSRISQKGLALIEREEGLRLDAYHLQGEQHWTIGYGHYGPDVKPGMRITLERAEELLRADVREAERAVAAACKAAKFVPTQNQFDALVSIVFNCGPGILEASRSLGGAIRKRNVAEIARAFGLYVKGGSPLRTLPGLVARRQRERALFLS
jgi:GH24 family phage-related lysozyme (muramidase)